MLRKKCAFAFFTILGAALVGFAVSPQMQHVRMLPDTLYLANEQAATLEGIQPSNLEVDGQCVEIRAAKDQSASQIVGISPTQPNMHNTVTVKVLGVPIKDISVVVDNRYVIPGGQSIGVALNTKGALVVGTANVIAEDGTSENPAKKAGILPGNIIETINGQEIENAAHLSALVNELSDTVRVGIRSEDILKEVDVIPRKDCTDGKLRLGLWVRDSTAGVGTMTFYDPISGKFGALGHSITDIDTKTRMELKNGEIFCSNIVDVKMGKRGSPGELLGNFHANTPIGTIDKNTDFGIFGQTADFSSQSNAGGIEVCVKEQVKLGQAELLSTVDSSGVRSFSCEILRIVSQEEPSNRSMVVQITDPALLEITGGIVQGMSGSPILQDGKIIGALTHVLVNDPTKGYGMFIEYMLDQAS